MFPNINRTFQLLQLWLKYPRRQAALIRKIVDRIRNSLELQVVLQTAVDEVAALLKLDGCKFLWYFKDTQRIQVVCEHSHDTLDVSHLGYHPLESFGAASRAIAAGELITNSGTVRDNLPVEKGQEGFFQRMENLRQAARGWGSMAKQRPWLLKTVSVRPKLSNDSQANYRKTGSKAPSFTSTSSVTTRTAFFLSRLIPDMVV